MKVTPEQLVTMFHDGEHGAGLGVCEHTDDITSGDVFIAHDEQGSHIRNAIHKGAVAVVCSHAALQAADDVPVDKLFAVENVEEFAYELVQLVYAEDIARLKLIGITGTNGKTSTAYFACQLFGHLGVKAGYLGTLGYGLIGESLVPARNTTPDYVTLYRNLASLSRAGCSKVVMEVSSHGISLDRIRGLGFETLVFTNLSHDHLDFHGSMEAYEAAKLSLFTDYDSENWVVNADDRAGSRLIRLGMQHEAVKVTAYSQHHVPVGMGIGYRIPGNGKLLVTVNDAEDGHNCIDVNIGIDGRFNIENLLCAILICHVSGYEIEDIGQMVSSITPVPGRMECVENHDGVKVCVDYAHTPAGVDAVMQDSVLRGKEVPRTWCVIGCGGDRDTSKRAAMGAAASYADRLVITDDNVRGDRAEAIICDILKGIKSKPGVIVCRDRRQAINNVLDFANSNDLVLLLGKGDESSVIYGSDSIMQRDIDVVRERPEYS